MGRLKKINYGVGGGAPFSVTYTLDPNGNLTAMSDQAGSSSFTYDENSRMTLESRTQNATTKTARYAYFAYGRMQTLTTFANQTATFAYDNALRLTSQTDPGDAGRAITYAYDARSRRTRITFGSGIKQEVSYDLGGRIDLMTLKTAANAVLRRFDYDYGLAADGSTRLANYRFGLAVGVSEPSSTLTTYTYDDLARLSGATRSGQAPTYSQTYAYDLANNRQSAGRTLSNARPAAPPETAVMRGAYARFTPPGSCF